MPSQALAQRVLGDERLQLADELRAAAEPEERVDPILDGLQPQLLEALDLALRELLEGELGERRAAPEPERTDRRRP